MSKFSVEINNISSGIYDLQNMLNQYKNDCVPSPSLDGSGEMFRTVSEMIEIQKEIENEFILLVDNTLQFLSQAKEEFEEQDRRLSKDILVVVLDN